MVTSGIVISGARLEDIRARLKQGQLNALRELLPDRIIDNACREAGHAYRDRLLPPLVMAFHYLAAALWPEESFNAAAQSGGIPASTGSMSKARQRLPRAVMDRLGHYTCRSKTVDGAYKEMAAKVMAFNLVRCVMLKAAPRRERRPDRLSFSNARRLVVAYSLRMSAAPIGLLQALYDEMLDAIARVEVPHRPGRVEPRAVRRERKHYERLKISRRAWRLKHASVA